MDKNHLNKIIFYTTPIIMIAIVGIVLAGNGIITTEQIKLDSNTINTTLIIDYGNNDVETYNLKLSNATVYSALIQASSQNDFIVKSEFYDNYQSHYVTSINNFEEGNDNKFWQYYLNGEYGTIGSDLQPLKNNDIVEWKYQEAKI